MSEDVAVDLIKDVNTAFQNNCIKDTKLARLSDKLSDGNVTYSDAYSYATSIGNARAKAFKSQISPNELPDGRMYYNIASRLLENTLGEDYKLVSEFAQKVQKVLNEKNGISLNALKADKDNDRIKGFIDRISSEEDFSKIAWILDEPVKVHALSVVDDTIKKNTEFQNKAGVGVKVVRIAESNCCKWCADLDGTYSYPGVPGDVFARHDNCRCIVEYDGHKLTAYESKNGANTFRDQGEQERIEARKEYENKKEQEFSSKLKPYEKQKLIEEQTDLINKYGNTENLMLQGSSDELTRWSELTKQTGLSDKDILQELSKNADNWENLLDIQTEKQLKKFTDQLLDTATDEELSALRMWTGETYVNINRYERYGVYVDEISRNAANNIENVLSRMETPEDIIVRRGTGTKEIFEKMPKGWKEDPSLLVGKSFNDKGFTATSPIKDGGFSGLGENQAELFIKVPQGTHGAYLNSVAHNELECEFLLQKDYSYKIIKAEYRENPLPQLKGEYDLKVWVEVFKK